MDNTTDQKEDFKLIQKTDKEIEIEALVAKEIPDIVRKKLIEKKIDAYVYTPHPLLNGPRIHIHSSDPADDLISASEDVENDLKEFKELVGKEFKKVKKEDKKENTKKEEKKEEKNIEDEKKDVKSADAEEKSEKVGKKRGRPKKEEKI
ncbi:MAG: hypothetical protein CVT88_02510 [Candidatus Altiarchaeales archaeon HGW-Altiarchaeales-1]|nr:MAG: hypothetical protein CVT88_02510 [Candidatus Altiarchaeales archaeon HGW-Altiarchaeales-1]